MSKSVQDIIALIQEEDIKMVDFKMVDINGQFRHVTIPARDLASMPPTMAMLWWKRATWSLSPTPIPL